MPSNLIRKPIIRRDGVATNVWVKNGAGLGTDRVRAATNGVSRSAAPRVGNAIDYALDFDSSSVEQIPEPVWWDDYVRSSGQNKTAYISTPELLDVIPSSKGDLAVVWQPISQEKKDKSPLDMGHNVRVLYLYSMKTGEKEGYLRLSSISRESMAIRYGNDEFSAFRFHAENHHEYDFLALTSSDPYEEDEEDEPVDDVAALRKEVWLLAKNDFGDDVQKDDGTTVSYRDLTEDDIPNDDKVKSELAGYAKLINKDIKKKIDYYGTPFVDYSRLSEDLQRQALGATMYIYAAKVLARSGEQLRGSFYENQSDSARAMWEKMKSKMPERVSTIKLKQFGKSKSFPTLDFRS